MTPAQRAKAKSTIIDECLREAQGDTDAALSAASHMADTLSDEELKKFLPTPIWTDEYGVQHTPTPTAMALSLDGSDRRPCGWLNEFGLSVDVPLSNEDQRHLDRAAMLSTLATLDAALSTMNARGTALAMLDDKTQVEL